jgi:hypothetical protein
LKKSGDNASAERVKALAKPSSTAWAINQAWWQQRDRFQAMLDAGAAQRKAHVAWAQGGKADVRAAGEARRAAVGEVTDAAVEALGGRKAVTPDVQYRIAGTVEALASAGVPAGEVPGRLTRDLQSSGLDALTALAEAAGAAPRPTIVARGRPGDTRQVPAAVPTPVGKAAAPAPVKKAPPSPAEAARERKAREAEETAAQTRSAQLAQARSRLAALNSALAAATQASDRAAADAAEARAELEARTKQRTDLEGALDDARAAEAEARRALSNATAAASRAEMDKARAARDEERAREAVERLEPAK